MTITDPQIRAALAGLLATVEAEREQLIESHLVLSYDSCETIVDLDDNAAATLAEWVAQISAGKVAIEELVRRAAALSEMRAAGGALA